MKIITRTNASAMSRPRYELIPKSKNSIGSNYAECFTLGIEHCYMTPGNQYSQSTKWTTRSYAYNKTEFYTEPNYEHNNEN